MYFFIPRTDEWVACKWFEKNKLIVIDHIGNLLAGNSRVIPSIS
jgi:hypothetical protein